MGHFALHHPPPPSEALLPIQPHPVRRKNGKNHPFWANFWIFLLRNSFCSLDSPQNRAQKTSGAATSFCKEGTITNYSLNHDTNINSYLSQYIYFLNTTSTSTRFLPKNSSRSQQYKVVLSVPNILHCCKLCNNRQVVKYDMLV